MTDLVGVRHLEDSGFEDKWIAIVLLVVERKKKGVFYLVLEMPLFLDMIENDDTNDITPIESKKTAFP